VLVLSVRLVKPSLDRVATWRLALALSLPAILLNPVLITIGFGQVNLFVTFLVMWDLLSERRIGKRQLPLGVATGLAAAVKPTPLLFVPYLVLTRRWRGALTAAGTFVACELFTFAVSPTSSKAYWTKAVFKPGRAGDLTIVDNQNLWGVLDRFTHGVLPDGLMLPLLVVTGVAGLLLAAQAHRRSSPLLGVLICAATCLLVSPISWVHHLVWVVPAILWLAFAPDRPRWGPALAGVTAVLFWSAPVWWVPYKNTSDLHLGAWQLVAGNSFFFAMVVFVAGAAVLVFRRGPGRAGGAVSRSRLLP
jgi:alpha-1,2-mannosyltransferase